MKKEKEEINNLLGDNLFLMFEDLTKYVLDHYKVSMEFTKGGKYGDTCVRFIKGGKSLMTYYLRDKELAIWIILGKDEREKYENSLTSFPKGIQDVYEKTPILHDGKWLNFDLTMPCDYMDFVKLLEVKAKPNRNLTRCGYCCDECKAYKKNILKNDQRETLQTYWKDYYDLDLGKEEMVCDGCLCKDKEIKLINNNCTVRKCVMAKGLDDCSSCEEFPCDEYLKRKGLCYDEADKIKKLDLPSYYENLWAFDNQSRFERKKKLKK